MPERDSPRGLPTQRQEPETHVSVTSAYGARTQQPLVNLAIGDSLHTWPAAKAREIGLLLVEVAFAAEADAFVLEFVRDQVGAGDQAAQIIVAFREWRRKKEARDA